MRLKVTVAYNGSNYNGWQIQNDINTIQATIQQALAKIIKQGTKIVASGRTDTGVHALGQVFHFDTNLDMAVTDWKQALNSLLPDDIFVHEVLRVADDFHARYDVKYKTYRYLLNMGEYDPFTYQLIYQYGKSLDVERMRECLKVFIGEHDFSSFCGNKIEETPDQIRTIYDIQIVDENDIMAIEFIGSGFLRYMIRMIVATLIKVGENKLSISEVQAMLEAKDKEACSNNAPGCGLYLVTVEYEEEL